MRYLPFLLPSALLMTGCHLPIRTDSQIRMEGQLKTDLPPVPDCGPVKPVVVQAGTQHHTVAILDVDGLLLNHPYIGPGSYGENPVDLFREKLDTMEAGPLPQAIVLRINSPGGGVAACIAMRRDLLRFKERTGVPVVACLLDTATGGAYYLASAADCIVAGAATVTGGIGVILNLYNLKDLMAQFNIMPQTIKAGNFVDLGTSNQPLKPEEKEQLQTIADEFHGILQEDILRSRSQIDKKGGTTFDGRIFTGTQALNRRLVDQIGDLDDAIGVAARLGCASGNSPRPRVLLYRRSSDGARTPYAVTANSPLQGSGLLPSIPGIDRSKLPTFLSVWECEPTLEKLGGK